MWNVVASLMLAVGTFVQAITSLREWSEERQDLVHGALAVKEMRDESRPWLHPIAWWRNRRTVATLLHESPSEVSSYRRLRSVLWGWTLMATGSIFAFGIAVVDAVVSR